MVVITTIIGIIKSSNIIVNIYSLSMMPSSIFIVDFINLPNDAKLEKNRCNYH